MSKHRTTHIRDQRALAHEAEQLLALLGAADHLVPQEVSAGQVDVAILGHNVVTLSSLARPRATLIHKLDLVKPLTIMSSPMIQTIGRDIVKK